MSESFLVCFRPASPEFDFGQVDTLLQQKFPAESPRRLEPGAWVLKSDQILWARNILEQLSHELHQLSGGAMMVRSIRDPRDFAVYPPKANDYTEFCNLQALVKKHHLHPD